MPISPRPRCVLGLVCGFALAPLIFSCEKNRDNPVSSVDAATDAQTLPEPFVFDDQTPSLLLSVLSTKGQPMTFEHPSEVPQAYRQRVMVVDLSQSPEQRQADRFVFFADLQKPDRQGRFQARPMSRFRQHANDPGGAARTSLSQAEVTIYTAPWCGFCKKAKAYLKKKGVAFVERDVEGSAAAARELQAKLRTAGAAGGGVPVIDIGGELIMGFDKARIDALLSKRSARSPTSQPRP